LVIGVLLCKTQSHKKKAFIVAIPKIVNTFALNLNINTIGDLNRLNVVLVEQKKNWQMACRATWS
jgi:hypothetical protein